MNFYSVRSNMLRPLLAWCLALLASAPALASKCYLAEAMGDKALMQNAAFWDEYGALAARGVVDQQQVLALARKHNPSFGSAPSASAAAQAPRSSIRELAHHKRAQLEIERLQPALKRRYNLFLETIQGPEGVQAFYRNPGSWHMERLPQFGKNAHSVRLNGDVRVLFDLDDGKVLVREVNRGHIHGG